MFNSNFVDFDDDPFFSDPFRAHRDHMRHMMRSFSEPYGAPLMPSIMDGRSRGRDMAEHRSSSLALRDEHRDMVRNPFGMFDSMMANVRNRMEEMHRNSIKETRRALKDSESGLEKMAIGHHIQDRGHVVEKKVNKKTGEKEFNQDFQNMDESEASSFDDEWQQKVSTFQPSGPMSHLKEPQIRGVHRAALTSSEQAHRSVLCAQTP
ncbi:Myeloid leukemia factor 1 [Nibea albiflora]|uniref:Myeloid leukemia factor 1 n=1 Tax=Nibea albiflora TaxID=240163 RepID=A0ACB7EIZ1_NIBAL|nr:Myeloid leukemia factor 1 [Nibea albiflora]